MAITAREYLKDYVFTKEMLDRFFDPKSNNWAAFDPELGYVGNSCVCKDGIDDCNTIYTYQPSGARRMIHYADQTCRINTYGDSMTQCHQVSDGETWEEYLAAHIGEPVRNFGMGGYGVYQAYKRMLRNEGTEGSAEYIILNIYPDDHRRSIYKCRYLHIGFLQNKVKASVSEDNAGFMFHANPWSYLRLNLSAGEFEECKNSFSSRESLYELCDEETFYEAFQNDSDVQALLAINQVADTKTDMLKTAAEILEVKADYSTLEAAAASARILLDTCAVRASMYILDKVKTFAKTKRKKLFVLLSCSARHVSDLHQGNPRFDQAFIDYLREKEFLFVDVCENHIEELRRLDCPLQDTFKLYFIGHYNPRGNHFFAFSIKNTIVNWLEPKPPAYAGDSTSMRKLAATFV